MGLYLGDIRKTALLSSLIMGGACFLATSCTMYDEGILNDKRAEVTHQVYTEKFSVMDMNKEVIKDVALNYTRQGAGGAAIVVTYDPKDRKMTAMKATQEAARIGSLMRRYGMDDVSVRIMPAQGDDAGAVLVSYNAYTAHAPDDCGVIPGLEAGEFKFDPDYKLGCSTEAMLARQVARPRDLVGQDMSDKTMDGRYASQVVDVYRTGLQNKPLGGQRASN